MAEQQQPLITFDRNYAWQNKHLNVSANVERLYEAWNRWRDQSRPEQDVWQPGLSALQQIVRDAEVDIPDSASTGCVF